MALKLKGTEGLRGIWIGDMFIDFRTATEQELQILAARASEYIASDDVISGVAADAASAVVTPDGQLPEELAQEPVQVKRTKKTV